MAATLEWDIPMTLTTPVGTLALNQLVSVGTTHVGYYLLDHLSCASGAELRVSRDDLPQASGEIQHLHYKAGYEMRFKIELWETIGAGGQPAWRETRVALGDLLQLHLESILGQNPFSPLASGRIQWTPSGASQDRMLDQIRLLERPVFTDEEMLTVVTFGVVSPFPYAMDNHEIDTFLPAATPTTLANTGTAPFYPVIKVHGPATFFTITNSSVLDINGTPLTVTYDSSLPGGLAIAGGHYAEFNFFRNTVYLDGNSSNLKPGVDLLNSDFFPLMPGNNILEIVGATADVLWQAAYS